MSAISNETTTSAAAERRSSGSTRARSQFTGRRVRTWQLIVLAAILLLWQFGPVNPLFVSRPVDVVIALYRSFASGEMWLHIWMTMSEVIIGYAIAVVVGVALGVLLGRSRFLAAVIEPFIMGFYSIPKIALAPLFVLWLGIGIESKIAIVFLSAFFLVFFNTFSGMRSIDEELVNAARIMGLGPAQIARRVVVPASMPFVMLGLRAAVPYGVIGAIVGEFIAANAGLGFFILAAGSSLNAANMFAGLIVLVTLVSLINIGLKKLERRMLRWNATNDDQPMTGRR